MSTKTNLRLPLSEMERANLRKNETKIGDFLHHAPDELARFLNATPVGLVNCTP